MPKSAIFSTLPNPPPKTTMEIPSELVVWHAERANVHLVSFTVPEQPVEKTVAAAKFLPSLGASSGTHPSFETVINKPGPRISGLWSPRGGKMDMDEWKVQIRKLYVVIGVVTYRGRPANLEELAAYEAVQRFNGRIYALSDDNLRKPFKGYPTRCQKMSPGSPVYLEFWTSGLGIDEGVALVIFEPVPDENNPDKP